MEKYVATVHDNPRSAYLERLRHAETKLSIFKIGEKHVVAATEYSALMAFADSFDFKKLSHDDLKALNRDLLFAAEKLTTEK